MFQTTRRRFLQLSAASLIGSQARAQAEIFRAAMVTKVLGVGYYRACEQGGGDAARNAGGVEFVPSAPFSLNAMEQATLIDSLLALPIKALAVTAIDPVALAPVCRKAMEMGVRVVSFEAAMPPNARNLHLNPTNDQLIGETLVSLMAKAIASEGEIAILSGAEQSVTHMAWVSAMRNELSKPIYANMPVITTVHGDDALEKSYREAALLIATYPTLRGIIAPTEVGLPAVAKAVSDAGKTGKIEVTGLGLPSQMKDAVMQDTVASFALWNPVDLGYAAMRLAIALARNEGEGASGSTLSVGRLGQIAIAPDGTADLGPPFIFDKKNIEKFAQLF